MIMNSGEKMAVLIRKLGPNDIFLGRYGVSAWEVYRQREMDYVIFEKEFLRKV